MSTETLLARPKQSAGLPTTVKGWLTSEYFKQQIALALPKHMTADRFMRVALTALTRIPKLANCTPNSVIKCMLTCSELGLEPDGRRAHLIPFENRKMNCVDCTLIIDYKGLAELAQRSGTISNIHADIVCENDDFQVNRGQLVSHVVDYKKPRGPMYAAYALIRFKDGGEKCEVMSKQDIDRIRSRSKAANNGPWVTDYDEMAKKTVFKRSSKWITLSPELADAMEKEDELSSPASMVEEVTGLTEAPAIEVETETRKPLLEQRRTTTAAPQETEPEQAQEAAPEGEGGDLGPQAQPKPEQKERAPSQQGGAQSPQAQLAEIVTGAGFNFDDFIAWGINTGNIVEVEKDNILSFDDVDDKRCKRFIVAKVGLLRQLTALKAGK